MQKERRRTSARKRRRNFPPNQPGLAHARDRNAPLASEEHVYGLGEARVQSRLYLLQRARLNLQDPAGRFQAHDNPRVLITPFQLGRSSACLPQAGCARTSQIPLTTFPNGARPKTTLSV